MSHVGSLICRPVRLPDRLQVQGRRTGWTIRGPIKWRGQVVDLKRRIPILKRLIADCDRLATDLDQEVRNEEHRVKIHDPAHSAYSIYAKATASRRDNLRRSADELRAHLAKAEKALIEFMAIRRLTCKEGVARNGVAGKNVGQSE